MTVTQDTLRLIAAARDQLDGHIRGQTNTLTQAWVTAWNDVSHDLNLALQDLLLNATDDTVSRALMLRSSRLMQALMIISAELDLLSNQAGATIRQDLPAIVDQAGRAQVAVIGSQLPPGQQVDFGGWDRVDARQVQAIVARSTQRIVSDLRPLSPQAYAALRAELVRGVTIGDNPRLTAARMLRRAEYRFNGGLTRALVVSRTESLDAHRAAAGLAMQESPDVVTGWRWLAALDTRTCPACWAKNGSEHPLSEPGPLGHQQCRCSRTAITKSWADLGFDGLEEPESLFPDAQARFNDLSPAEQRKILGPARYEAWLAGEFPISKWAIRRSNPGWRDGYYVAPVPSRSASAAA